MIFWVTCNHTELITVLHIVTQGKFDLNRVYSASHSGMACCLCKTIDITADNVFYLFFPLLNCVSEALRLKSLLMLEQPKLEIHFSCPREPHLVWHVYIAWKTTQIILQGIWWFGEFVCKWIRCLKWSQMFSLFLTVLSRALTFNKLTEACRVWDVALGFFTLGWACWDVHSWEDWQLSWMFSTCE